MSFYIAALLLNTMLCTYYVINILPWFSVVIIVTNLKGDPSPFYL